MIAFEKKVFFFTLSTEIYIDFDLLYIKFSLLRDYSEITSKI